MTFSENVLSVEIFLDWKWACNTHYSLYFRLYQCILVELLPDLRARVRQRRRKIWRKLSGYSVLSPTVEKAWTIRYVSVDMRRFHVLQHTKNDRESGEGVGVHLERGWVFTWRGGGCSPGEGEGVHLVRGRMFTESEEGEGVTCIWFSC